MNSPTQCGKCGGDLVCPSCHPSIISLQTQLAITENLLSRLFTAASEQQHTLGSLGWHTPTKEEYPMHNDYVREIYLGWSKAGARRHQYLEIEKIMAEIRVVYDKLRSKTGD